MKRFFILVLVALFVASSCSHQLEGPSPTVEDSSLTYCGADTQSFVITGGGLSPMVREGATEDARVDLPDVCLIRLDASGNPAPGETEVCLDEKDVEWVSKSEIRFTLRSNEGLTPGSYQVVIKNPDGKRASGTVTVLVLADGPLVFWADPSVVFNGIATQVTIFGANLGTVSSVVLRNSDTREELPALVFTQTGTLQNRVQAIVPKDTPVGTYDVVVKSDNGCQAELLRGLVVTDTVTLTVTAIDPSFGWTDEPTPVTITGADFSPVPRAYLNPENPAPDTVAATLSSVAFVGKDRLTGVVPKGLKTGKYDLIVVNPDGRVGLLKGAFAVTAEAPPVVENVSPSYLDNDGAKTVTVEGSNFRNPGVTLTCKAPDGTVTTLTGTVSPGGTGTSFQVSLPVGGLAQGTVCVVRVTNDDGSYYDYSAIGISNPASNLNAFVSGPSMKEARRAPSVAAARATGSARFLYAIGGDNGSAAGASASVEAAPIDVFGAPGDWFDQPVSLPGSRTMAGVAAVGRFLYLVGGNDGKAATASVVRAQVLDPLKAPKIIDVAARRSKDKSQGIGAGVWYYRVSAVMADTDPSNPGGESLPSDPLVVSLAPETVEAGTLVLTLFWEKVPGAKVYRIYRSPTGDLPVGSELRLAQTPGDDSQYEDTALGGPIGGPPPLPLGATGVWMKLPDLGTAREAAGVVAARDPASAAKWHLYVMGGRSSNGPALASWERLGVDVAADGSHTVAAWTAGGGNISKGRAELSAFSVSHAQAAQVPAGTTYVYAGGGVGSSDTDVAQVAAGGDLAWSAVDSMNPLRAGYAGLPGAGFLFAFGGSQGSPSDSCASAEIDPSSVPALVNWNNEGVKMTIPRYFAGSSVESAFIYVVGGQTTGGATATIERTVL